MDYIFQLMDPRATLETVGGKGASLAKLAKAGLPVPGGFHLTTAAYRQFVAENNLQASILAALDNADVAKLDTLETTSRTIAAMFLQPQLPPAIAEAVTQAYALLGGAAVAVRSSATAEDLPDLSFAGQQETFLNIHGAEAVLEAVKKCWASLWTARAIGYRLQHHIDQTTVSLAVVVQTLVPADAAGVLFTANPVTGQRDQAMLTATWGLGEAIVGGLVTPDTLIVDKATGRVLSRETADKQVMTVRVAGGTEEQPVPESQRTAPVLDDQQAAALVRLGVQIEQHYGMPMDIEWTLADGQFAIVQARPITALPEPEVSVAPEWKVPDPKRLCFRSSIVEQLPDPLTPLFATLGGHAIGVGSARLFNDLLGKGTTQEDIFFTINGYAYYQMRFDLSLVVGAIRAIISFWPLLVSSEQRWRDAHARYAGVIAQWRSRLASGLTAGELLEGARGLMAETVNVYNVIQSGTLGLAGGTEMIFVAVYDRLVKRPGDPAATDFLLGLDSLPLLAEKSLYDLAQQGRANPALAEYLTHTPTAQLAEQLTGDQIPAGLDADNWRAWQRGFGRHLEQYGHAVYNLDFSKPVAADNPAPVLETCKLYVRGQGQNPHERLRAQADRRTQATQAMLGRLKGLRLKLFRKTLQWAQAIVPQREDCLADLGLGYPLLRQLLRELGRRLSQAGMLPEPEAVYWLTEDEAIQAAAAFDRGEAVSSRAEAIWQRQALWRAQKRLTPPTTLPERSRMGRYIDQLGPARMDQAAGNLLKGAGACQGRVTGKARVLHGPEDFAEMQPGEILVAAITTPAWTPLFAMASAIVTDVGGPLSHGSIVAREYGLPAVLGTGVATKRIRSGQVITVDGTAGTVTLEAESGAPAPIEWKLPKPNGRYMRGSTADLMADPMCPLFISLALPAISERGIRRILATLTASEAILPDDYVTSINGYLYASMNYTARQWGWILTRMIPSFPRILRMGLTFWRDEMRPRYAATAKRWEARPVSELSPAELLAGVRELVDVAGEYIATLLVATMGASGGSEALFTRVYEKLVQRAGDPPAVTFLMGYNSLPIRAEKSLFDIAAWLRGFAEMTAQVLNTPTPALVQHLATGEPPAGLATDAWAEFQARFRAHLEQYGHAIYNLDFSSPLPLDQPAPLLETIKLFLRGEGVNPHLRQGAAEQKREHSTQVMLARLRGWHRWAFEKALRWAQSLSAVREEAIADIGLGYPALRRMLRELGRRCAEAGAVARANDVYWLKKEELAEAASLLENHRPLPDLQPQVQERQAFQIRARAVTAPPVLPVGKNKYMGMDVSAFTPPDESSQTGSVLKGVATSAGRVTAPARVLHGPEDFGEMRLGDVLVAGTTTPAWTPLFAMAAAVVTDVGGPLSHGSIVAREYGIPAVMGTGVATKRIHSGQVITVDGSLGTVNLGKNGK